ncbi:MAG: helix-turn-helix transcriptional regulator [Spirochaetales bacterium]|nr:helix-turn-helix transcriptional regulator [Spirochaetales bacterium]
MTRILNTEELGKAIKDRRKALGMTQSELAMYCNTGIRFISDLERGKPTIQFSKALAVLSMLALNLYIGER